MEHTHTITAMTCSGCRFHVEETLSNVEGVTKVSVDMEKAEVSIEMEKHIQIELFQKALKEAIGRYQIHLPGEEAKN